MHVALWLENRSDPTDVLLDLSHRRADSWSLGDLSVLFLIWVTPAGQ